MPETHDITENPSLLSPEGFTAFQQAIENLPVDTLRSEIERLHNSTFHLRRTNAELTSAAEENEEDRAEYRLYVTENEDVIRTNAIKISLLQNQLRRVDSNYDEPEQTQIMTASESRHIASGATDLQQDGSEIFSSVPNGHAANGTTVGSSAETEDYNEGVFL